MKIILNAAIIGLLLITAFDCNDNVVNPQEQPGRRDYTWELDTLNMPMNYLGAVWGATPTDVWAVGAGGTSFDRLQHYDGKKWSAYTKEPVNCGGNTIFGFSENTVWMGGRDELSNGAAIWHYDGNSWSRNYIYHAKGEYINEVTDIWGLAPNNIFACGYIVEKSDSTYGFILRYDGNVWKEVIRVNYNSQFLVIKGEISGNSLINISSSKVYVYEYRPSKISSALDTLAFDELSGNRFKKIFANSVGEIKWANFNIIDNKLYFLIDKDVYIYLNGSFIRQFTLNINDSNFNHYIFGRSEKDMFLGMKDGLAHYNGEDIKYIFNFPQNTLNGIGGTEVMFEKEIFYGLVNFSNTKNIILHGTLK